MTTVQYMYAIRHSWNRWHQESAENKLLCMVLPSHNRYELYATENMPHKLRQFPGKIKG
jgi:hypothetical protein